ncbi:MAG: ferredoxin [Gammaproteobacteria bacterium]|nr:ferredoxin [Gammaproteobacteria bacterium]
MADKNSKAAKNVAGKFYVDTNCISCGQCHDVAPDFFVEDQAAGGMYVCKQPASADEIALCSQAKDSCPVDAIGDDS